MPDDVVVEAPAGLDEHPVPTPKQDGRQANTIGLFAKTSLILSVMDLCCALMASGASLLVPRVCLFGVQGGAVQGHRGGCPPASNALATSSTTRCMHAAK